MQSSVNSAEQKWIKKSGSVRAYDQARSEIENVDMTEVWGMAAAVPLFNTENQQDAGRNSK